MQRPFALLVLLSLWAMPVHAFTVSGVVLNTTGTPVSGADIDLIDRNTGINIPLTGDSTSTTGSYTIAGVPAGNYDVTVSPPTATRLAGGQILNQAIASDITLPTFNLPAGYEVRLQSVDYYGAPRGGINLDFYNAGNTKIFTANDTTDGSGFVSTFIPQGGGLYRLELVDTTAGGLPDKVFEDVQVLSDTDYGPVVVGPAQSVGGRTIRFSNSLPISNVDVDLVDSCGLSLKIAGDLTDALGNFTLTGVVSGYYDVIFRPTGLDRKEFKRVGIGSSLAFGDVRLGSLHTVTGAVQTTAGAPIPNIDLDFTDQAYGFQVILNNDNTTAAGTFLTETTDGIFTIDFRPPPGSPYAPKTLFDISVTADTNVGVVVLGDAVFLSGIIRRASDATPVEGAYLEVLTVGTGRKVFTPGGKADASGYYRASLESGTWDLRFSPPPGDNSLLPVTLASQSISADAVQDIYLPTLTAATNWWVYE